jgi:glucose-1-phosphate thymidylyltransferase
MDQGSAWLDTGTFASMMEAAEYIHVIEKRTGLKIGCIEEIAYREGYIDKDQLIRISDDLTKSGYGEYLKKVL